MKRAHASVRPHHSVLHNAQLDPRLTTTGPSRTARPGTRARPRELAARERGHRHRHRGPAPKAASCRAPRRPAGETTAKVSAVTTHTRHLLREAPLPTTAARTPCASKRPSLDKTRMLQEKNSITSFAKLPRLGARERHQLNIPQCLGARARGSNPRCGLHMHNSKHTHTHKHRRRLFFASPLPKWRSMQPLFNRKATKSMVDVFTLASHRLLC